MRSVLKLIAPAAILAAGLIFTVTSSPAKPDYTRRTHKECDFCHPPNSRELNDAGIYYRDHKYSLQGYQPKDQGKNQQTQDDKSQKK